MFLPQSLSINSFNTLKPYFESLRSRKINSVSELKQWLSDRSELTEVIEEDMAWRYINTNRHTDNNSYKKAFISFIQDILPHIETYENELNKKFINSPFITHLPKTPYHTLIRSKKKQIEIFRQENIPLFADMRQLEQEYGNIISKLTISHKGKEITLQQAATFLQDTDRYVREEMFKKINRQRLSVKDTLNELYTKLIRIRTQIARNAGYKNYRDYKFEEMGRFDYTVNDCMTFHTSVKNEIVPLVASIHQYRRKNLGLKTLKPWDTEVDTSGKTPLKPYKKISDLVDNTILAFSKLNPEFGQFLTIMKKMGHFDLESRKNKAPGGFNYPLYKTGVPFIFGNFTNTFHDLETMVHEGGHAIHSFLTNDLPLVDFKEFPSEVAELASMAMELLSMAHWNLFFPDKDNLQRAKRTQLENILKVLPWIMTIDKFQHWVYTNPDHSITERETKWLEIYEEFYPADIIDWNGFEEEKTYIWQKQLHLFEVPFYYIEYGFSQLGAIAVWKNFTENPYKAIEQYRYGLSLGYTKTIPEIYAATGIRFDFSQTYIHNLMSFVKEQLNLLMS